MVIAPDQMPAVRGQPQQGNAHHGTALEIETPRALLVLVALDARLLLGLCQPLAVQHLELGQARLEHHLYRAGQALMDKGGAQHRMAVAQKSPALSEALRVKCATQAVADLDEVGR